MDDLIKYIENKEEKYKNFKLKQVIYNRKENLLNVYLLYPDEFGIISNEHKKTIKELITEYINMDNIKINITYKKSYCNNVSIKKIVKTFLSKKYPIFSTAFDVNNLQITKNDSGYKLLLKVDKTIVNNEKLKTIKQDILNFLNHEHCYNFEIEFENFQINNDLIKKDEKKIKKELIYNNSTEKKLANVKIINQILGKQSDTNPVCVFSVKQPLEQTAVLGWLDNLEQREFKRKNPKEEDDKKGVFFSFDLKMDGEKLKCVIFPKKDDIEKIKQLDKLDSPIVVIGDVQDFNGSLSLKSRSISSVEIISRPKNKTIYKKAPKEYTNVLPEPVEVVSQKSFFDMPDKYPQYINDNDFVVFDLETTGLDYQDCEIIEIGAVKVRNGKIIEKFSSFVKPVDNIPEEITKITGINNAMVSDAPRIDQVLPDFYKFAENSVLLAYNIEFDFKFLNFFGKKQKFNFDNKQMDVLHLAQRKIKGLKNYKLKTVAEHLKIDLSNAHRAYYDAIATAKIFLNLEKL